MHLVVCCAILHPDGRIWSSGIAHALSELEKAPEFAVLELTDHRRTVRLKKAGEDIMVGVSDEHGSSPSWQSCHGASD